MIKNLFFILLLSCSMSCDDDESIPEPMIEQENIPFQGNWVRQFEAGPGNVHDVLYAVYQDSIRYTLSGPVGNANYVMLRDTFVLENNRYIGHTPDDQYYVLFVKDINSDNITLYKQPISSVEEGMTVEVPDAETTEHHGWSVYTKQ